MAGTKPKTPAPFDEVILKVEAVPVTLFSLILSFQCHTLVTRRLMKQALMGTYTHVEKWCDGTQSGSFS